MWFGDLVTMRWWDDVWLNEGFATWMANHPLASWKPDWSIPVDEELENQTALNLDSLASTRPIHAAVETPGQIEEAFDAIAYQKGAAVLRMIENYVGADTFRAGRERLSEGARLGQRDLRRTSGPPSPAASGKPVDAIMPTFVNQPGVPLLRAALSCAGGKTRRSRSRSSASRSTRRTRQPPATRGRSRSARPPAAPADGSATS